MIKRRGFLFLLGAAAAGLWLPEHGLVTLSRRMVIELSGEASCSFCGKKAQEVMGLAGVQRRPTRICNECIGLCCDILHEEVESEEPSAAAGPRAELPSADAEKELEEILAKLELSHRELLEKIAAELPPPPAPLEVNFADPACSFCGTAKSESRKIIAGPAVYVCDGCVGDAAGLFSQYLRA